MKVLVVDDDVVSRMMLMHLVDSCGSYDILEAEDGLDAWRQFEAGLRPAITFCDLRMPRLSGTELLVRVKAEPALAAMPFVLVSAANDGETMDEASLLGADGYVVKPFRVEQLRPHLLALGADEAPEACAARLGIDRARLALYFSGLDRQLVEAGPVLEGVLAAGDVAGAHERLARLREGCATLGLSVAAAQFARAEAAPRPTLITAALLDARAAVARQLAILEGAGS